MVWLQGLKLSKDEMASVFQTKLELGSEARTLDGLAWALPQVAAAPPLPLMPLKSLLSWVSVTKARNQFSR